MKECMNLSAPFLSYICVFTYSCITHAFSKRCRSEALGLQTRMHVPKELLLLCLLQAGYRHRKASNHDWED